MRTTLSSGVLITTLFPFRFLRRDFFRHCLQLFFGHLESDINQKKGGRSKWIGLPPVMGLVYFVLVCFVFIVLMVTGVGFIMFDIFWPASLKDAVSINFSIWHIEPSVTWFRSRQILSGIVRKNCRNRSQTISVDFTQQPIRFGCFYLFSLFGWVFFKWFVLQVISVFQTSIQESINWWLNLSLIIVNQISHIGLQYLQRLFPIYSFSCVWV